MAGLVEGRLYLYPQSITLGSIPHQVNVQDLEPAGLILHASRKKGSTLEYTLSIPEHELENARVVRTEAGLRRLVDSLELTTDGIGKIYLASTLPGISPPHKDLNGDNVGTYINNLKTGDEMLSETLTKGLAELCRVKPMKVDAIRWLGNWLVNNNPGQPQVQEA